MRVFCYAYEGMYQGLHGIESLCVQEVNSIEEINEWGRIESEELIYSYGLEDEYKDHDWLNEEESIDTGECGWYAYYIRDDVELSVNELDKECCNLGAELFIEEYCGKRVEL